MRHILTSSSPESVGLIPSKSLSSTDRDLGTVTPGITAAEYAHRRKRLADQLPDNAIAIIAASTVIYRTGHVFFDFHQDPDFFYLTGVFRQGCGSASTVD
jgi:hypothetical protein